MESIPQHGQPAWRSVTALWRSIKPRKGAGAPRHHPDVSFRGAKRRGALGAKREEVPLGCNLGKAFAARTSHRRTNTPPSLTVAAVSDRLVEEH